MKKILRFLLVQLLILTSLFCVLPQVTASAASTSIELQELGLKVTVPSGYSVITRDTPEGDPIFARLGTTHSTLISHFKSSNIYMNAVPDSRKEEIVVTNTKISLYSFNSLGDTLLDSFAKTMVDQYDDFGINISKYEIYEHPQTKFIKLYFTDSSETVHGLQYYTVYDGNAMNFTMRSYEGYLSSAQETNIKAVVDSIKYTSASTSASSSPSSSENKTTDPFDYFDPESGVSFTVPENWEEKEMTEPREYLDVKFVSVKDGACIIIYGGTDMWSQMSAAEKIGHTRAELNNSAFTVQEVAEMWETSADEVSVVNYNGKEYYKLKMTSTIEPLTLTFTSLVYIENGWVHLFQFGGDDTNKLYPDFESLMKSVRYASAKTEAGTVSSGDTVSGNVASDDTVSDLDYVPSESKSGKGLDTVTFIILLSLAVIAVVIAVIVLRKKSDEAKARSEYAPIYDASLQDPPGNTVSSSAPDSPSTDIFCRKCGQKLPSDSEFCHICGTKTYKDF